MGSLFDQPETCFVLDGHHRLYKAYHAVSGLTTPDGEPIGAVYGFVSSLLKLIRTQRPDLLVAVFDPPGRTFRDDLLLEYKAQRAPMPEAMARQLPLIQEVLSGLGIPVLELAGYEADDVLGSIAHQWAAPNRRIYLVTGDKDAKQCLGPTVQLFDAETEATFSPNELAREWGIRPTQVVDWLALAGDAADNIPGVAGIGARTARALLERYGDLERILAHADELARDEGLVLRGKARVASALKKHAAEARLSYELARLRTDLDLPLTPESARFRGLEAIDRPYLRERFVRWGFTTFLRELALLDRETDLRYTLVNTPEALEDLLAALQTAEAAATPGAPFWLSLDTETTGPEALGCRLVGISLSWEPGTGVYLPVRAPQGETVLPLGLVLEALRPFLENPSVAKVGHNLKFDLHVLWAAQFDPDAPRSLRDRPLIARGIARDSFVGAYLLNPGRARLSLDHLAVEFLARENLSIESLIGPKPSKRRDPPQRRMDEVPLAEVTPYAAEDADVALRLTRTLDARHAALGLSALASSWEYPLVEVLASMERTGICLDLQVLAALSQRLGDEARELEAACWALAGTEFNVRSSAQVAEQLFEVRGLPVQRRTKSGPSTDERVLARLAAVTDDPLPAKILAYREVHKLLSTYVEVLPGLVHPETGRLHASFNQCVTATGRLSSNEPNLQNIPIRSEAGRRIRAAFVPRDDDHLLLTLDYSQIELRLMAHLSGDQTLREAFARDQDVHTTVAAEVFDLPPADVTPTQRSRAKAVNFGLLYGQTAQGLAASLDLGISEAQTFIDAYFARFPGVQAYIDSTIATAHRHGYVTTILGRRRTLPELAATNRQRRQRAEREAINTTVQGSAADLIKVAMVRIHRAHEAQKTAARMLVQIHDELLFELPAADIEQERDRLADLMVTALPELSVPLSVSGAWGRNWQAVK